MSPERAFLIRSIVSHHASSSSKLIQHGVHEKCDKLKLRSAADQLSLFMRFPSRDVTAVSCIPRCDDFQLITSRRRHYHHRRHRHDQQIIPLNLFAPIDIVSLLLLLDAQFDKRCDSDSALMTQRKSHQRKFLTTLSLSHTRNQLANMKKAQQVIRESIAIKICTICLFIKSRLGFVRVKLDVKIFGVCSAQFGPENRFLFRLQLLSQEPRESFRLFRASDFTFVGIEILVNIGGC